MSIISLDQKSKRVLISSYELDNSIVFKFFDSKAAEERDAALLKALYIGVLALMEDRLSSFLSKTANHLGTELESLKLIFDMKQELFFKSAVKGVLAEEDIADFLTQFFSKQKLADTVSLTGNMAGVLPKNKTGDIVCCVNGEESLKIAIECKFDKSIKIGEIGTKDVFTKKSDTAWSQLLEAQANREGKISVIVFDVSLADNSIINSVQGVKFIPAVGLIAIIDSQKGDYQNLAIAYMLARDIAINSRPLELDKDILAIIVNRIVKDVKDTISIKNLVMANIDTNKKILAQLEKSLLSMDFIQIYLLKFLGDGQMSKEDLLSFYLSEEIKDKYKIVESEIKEITA